MESDSDRRQASSPPLGARTSLPSVSGVLLAHGIDTCLLASQGIRHILWDGFHSVHAMLSSVSHAKVSCRKAPAASRVSLSALSRTRYHGYLQPLIPGKRL
jgi:hypothetical protein